MFIDKAKIKVAAGNGGDGLVSFRHERYIDKGGPDGGDGGQGGSVILVASNDLNTLATFRYNKLLKAQNGADGGQSHKRGKSGKDLIVLIPVGTVILNDQDQVVSDLTKEGQQAVIATGGKGGFGNAHFTSSVRQTPRVAEKGEKGENFDLTLELKMIADVGLVGLPNAGKSSLLAAVSNARPEIADYPFTTLIPHLGVADVDGQSLLIADIPGLIKGASNGKGLGDEFLKHVSRCSVLLHLIDVSGQDVAKDYQAICSELKAYSDELAKKPEVIALTKVETLPEDLVQKQAENLKKILPKKVSVYLISSYAKKGLQDLLRHLQKEVQSNNQKALKKATDNPELPIIALNTSEENWQINQTEEAFVVTGVKIERFAARTDFNNPAGVQRLKDIMKKMGIMQQLQTKGINPGDKIVFGNPPINTIGY